MRKLSELNINEGGKAVRRGAPSGETVAAFEKQFNVKLPRECLALLHYSNGGHPELDSFAPVGKPGHIQWSVDHFYHLGDDRNSAINLWFVMEKWQPVLGNYTLPFARDGGGNQFFLDLRTTLPAVKVCVHDENLSTIYWHRHSRISLMD